MVLAWLRGVDDAKPIFPTYLEAFVQALNGKYVVTGLEVTSSGNNDLVINVASGKVKYDMIVYDVNGTSFTLTAAPTGTVRYDVIVWDGVDQALKVLEGTGTLSLPNGLVVSKTARLEDTQIPLAVVRVNGTKGYIDDGDIFDARVSVGDFATNLRTVEVSSDYEAKYNDAMLVDTSAGDVTIVLPEPRDDNIVLVKKTSADSNAVLIMSVNGELIDGENQIEIYEQDVSLMFFGSGGKWVII